VPHESKIEKPGKPDFAMIEAKVLTIEMERTSGTRGHFDMVLSVRFSGHTDLVARCQGVPEEAHFGR
jgi:hypothetical protein